MHRLLWPLAAVAALLLGAPEVGAQPDAPQDEPPPPGSEGEEGEAEADPAPPPPAPVIENEEDEEEPEPPLVPPALDTLGGHLMAAGTVAWAIPFGSFEDNAKVGDSVGSGPAFGVDLGYGISRTVVLGLWGQYTSLGSGDRCSACSGTSLAVGPYIAYHLVQGVRFDPWMSAGLGFRTTKVSGGGSDISYSGVEWLRLTVGGEWYAFSNFGFGAFMELDMGVYTARSEGEIGGKTAHWQYLIGGRIAFDTPGK